MFASAVLLGRFGMKLYYFAPRFTKPAQAIVHALLLVAPAQSPAGTISFNYASGYCESPFKLNVCASDKDTIIYYTTNGDTPNPATARRYADQLDILTTTIVRAAAFNRAGIQSGTGVRTFLFPTSILRQTGAQLPNHWGANGLQLIPAHYEMSVAQSTSLSSRQKVFEALHSLPVISVGTEWANLFDAGIGIYLQPAERGAKSERPVSVELFNTAMPAGFQIDGGLRIHGGMSRWPEESPKHSFRIHFKKSYGRDLLRYPLFGTEGRREFADLILRAGNNDSWLDSDGIHRCHAAYIRDEWMRRSMQDMGYASVRGNFVHLYLNGLYWGLYNLCERPDTSWLAASQTNAADGFDFRKADKIESGDDTVWNQLLTLANAGASDDGNYEKIKQLIDLTEFADYLILNFYAGNSDWDRSANWLAARRSTSDGRFQFFVWDAERTLDDPALDTLDFDDDESPSRLFHKLSENAAFRKLFAARVQQLLFDKGPLSPDVSSKRFQTLADSVAGAMPAEAARWGSYRQDVYQFRSGPYQRYTEEKHWQAEVARILTQYFPRRREVLLKQFRDRGLFPGANLPASHPSQF